MSFPRYPAYRDSGVEWLGYVPEHWRVDRLKSVISLKKNIVGADSGDFKLLSLTLRGVIPRDLDNPQGKFPTDFDGYQAVQPDDLIFCLFDVEETPRAVGIAREAGMVTGAYTVGAVKADHCSDFIHYYYLSRDQYKALKMYYTGLRNVIRKENFYDIPCPLPPPTEQQVIAAFLDRETAKIDALVAEQEQLITLLKEKRQAVMSHAVTKGLDPSVPMKDSGVEWLGEVPAHWSITPVKHLGRLKGGAGFPHSEQGVEGEELCFYKVGALGQSSSTGYLTDSENTVSRETANALGAFIFPKETLVFAKVGAALFLGRVRALPADACLDNNMMGLVVDEERHAPAFVRYAMSLVRFDLIANPGAVPSLNEGQIGNYVLACPPSKAEQGDIAAFLDRATVQLEGLLAQTESVIATLQERRSALISAAVTGQIDVRGLAPAQEQAT